MFLGGVQLALYAAVLVLSYGFKFGAEDRPILAVVGLFVAATLAYFAALAMVLRRGSDVLITVWFMTFGVRPAIVALVVAKHVLVAIYLIGMDAYPAYKDDRELRDGRL